MTVNFRYTARQLKIIWALVICLKRDNVETKRSARKTLEANQITMHLLCCCNPFNGAKDTNWSGALKRKFAMGNGCFKY